MSARLFAPLLLLAASCATLTPERCQSALTGLTQVQDIIARLQALGYQSDVAAKIAQALAVGQITLATACAASNP